MQVRVIQNITKEYPDMYKIVVYKTPKYFIKSDSCKRNKKEVSEDYVPKISSLKRTKTTIRDLVLCNDFELFCTFTFNPQKVDSFNFYKCWGVMSRWLHHQSDLSRSFGKDFKYLIVPEKHKSGRFHFHALISGYSSQLRDSHCVTSTLRPIYNITSFRSGFTTAVYIDDKQVVASYVSKYITKDFVQAFNQRRFFCSRGLVRPQKSINSGVFRSSLPLFRHCVVDSLYTQEFLIDK